MAASQNLLTREDDLGMLGADDARIPDEVRTRFTAYDRAVATVVPVISLSREEWWLFDADGTLVDMLSRRTGQPGAGVLDAPVRKIVHRAIHAESR